MRYLVFVKPNSKKGPLVEETASGLTVYLREKPVDGAANEALIKILAEYFKVNKAQVSIKTGKSARHKIIEILF